MMLTSFTPPKTAYWANWRISLILDAKHVAFFCTTWRTNETNNFNSPNIQVTLQVPAACLEDHSSDLKSFTLCCWQRSLTPWPFRKKNSCNNLMSQQHWTGSWNSIGAISGLSRAVTPMKEFPLGREEWLCKKENVTIIYLQLDSWSVTTDSFKKRTLLYRLKSPIGFG